MRRRFVVLIFSCLASLGIEHGAWAFCNGNCRCLPPVRRKSGKLDKPCWICRNSIATVDVKSQLLTVTIRYRSRKPDAVLLLGARQEPRVRLRGTTIELQFHVGKKELEQHKGREGSLFVLLPAASTWKREVRVPITRTMKALARSHRRPLTKFRVKVRIRYVRKPASAPNWSQLVRRATIAHCR